MTRRQRWERAINQRAIEVLTACSPAQREGALDRLTDACIEAYGTDNFELRRDVDRALERAQPIRRI